MLNFEHILTSKSDVAASLKSTKRGKAYSVDGLAAEHSIFSDDNILTILSNLYKSFLTHGYIPTDFMRSAISPIIKSKTGDITSTSNYMQIALVTAICLSFVNFVF